MAEKYMELLEKEEVSAAIARRDRKRKTLTSEDNPIGKMPKLENESSLHNYNDYSYRMMAKMGFTEGEGLGKLGQGITQPVEASKQKGRRGLGLNLDKLEREDVKWEEEKVECEQAPDWIPKHDDTPLTEEDLTEHLHIGQKKTTIEDETSFCDPRILKRILSAKEIFDHLERKEFLEARLRSNPFETIKGVFFQNRAAMKMANIDAMFDYNFTYPKRSDGQPAVVGQDLLYFADICAGPGGFSEYVLWRRKWHAKGFGLTLRDPNDGFDFKLDEFFAAPSETFEPYYGENGINGNGDITKPENLIAFKEYVMEHTGSVGVHFVMGDGGISVEGEENIQEILTKQLILCQFLCALSILRPGGNFVCKTFDLFTTFNVGLIYLLYRCFEKVCIIKPVTSRPANSERYVVCLNKISYTEPVHDHLFNVNSALNKLKVENEFKPSDEKKDVLEVIPLNMITDDNAFMDYMIDSNNSLGFVQAIALKKIQYFVKNPILMEMRQTTIRETCLKLWKIPDEVRQAPKNPSSSVFFNEMWTALKDKTEDTADHSILDSVKFTALTKESMCKIKDVHSWRFYFACGIRLMLLGLGRNVVYAWEMKHPFTFSSRKDIKIQLPAGTILEVELVDELTGQGGGQRKCHVLYIVDVICIHHEMYGDKPFKERFAAADKLARAVNKPSIPGNVLLKVKPFYKLFHIENELSKLKLKKCKGFSCPVPTYQVYDDKSIAPKGLILYKVFRDPWEMHWSNSKNAWYFFNNKNQKSRYDCPPDSVASFISFVKSRHIWLWTKPISFAELCGKKISEMESTALEEGLEITRDFMRTYVKSSLHPQ